MAIKLLKISLTKAVPGIHTFSFAFCVISVLYSVQERTYGGAAASMRLDAAGVF